MAKIQKVLPFVRHYVVLAVCDVLEQEQLPYQKLGDVLAIQMSGQTVLLQITEGSYGTALCLTSSDSTEARGLAEALIQKVVCHLDSELLHTSV